MGPEGKPSGTITRVPQRKSSRTPHSRSTVARTQQLVDPRDPARARANRRLLLLLVIGLALATVYVLVQALAQRGGWPVRRAVIVGTFAGVEARPIQFDKDALQRSASIPEMLDEALEAMTGAVATEPMYLENVPHPVSSRLGLAHATRSHVHAFGIDWDNTSGTNNGHFASFDSRGWIVTRPPAPGLTTQNRNWLLALSNALSVPGEVRN
jgi:hypothetical protein